MPAELDLDSTGASSADARDSRLLAQALRTRKDAVGGTAALPDDPALSDKILAQARVRSAQLSASQQPSSHAVAQGRPIPWWLWLAWLLAIVAAVLALRAFA